MIVSSSAQTLTINGSGFQAGLSVIIGYTSNFSTLTGSQITLVSSTQITLSITVGTTVQPWLVKVINSNGGTSTIATFQVSLPPAPAITSLSPNPMTATGSAQTLTINGTGFLAGLSVIAGYTNNFSTLTGSQVTLASSTQLTLSINVGTASQAWLVKVINANGEGSSIATLTVNALPPPVITSLGPNPMIVSASSQTLTINGTGFVTGLSVVVGYASNFSTLTGSQLTSVSATKIVLPLTVGTTVQSWLVKVINPNGEGSSVVTLPVTPVPSPVITSLSPSPMTGSTFSQSLTINGSGFQTGSSVIVGYASTFTTLTGSQLTFVSATQIVLPITTGLTAQQWLVKVANPNGAGSSVVAFQVNAPTLAITSLSPSPMTGSTSAQALTINGIGFQAGLSVIVGYGANFNTLTSSQLTSVTATKIVLPITVGTTAQSWLVKVVNPSGLGTNIATFLVH
jgi:hypothetical protein